MPSARFGSRSPFQKAVVCRLEMDVALLVPATPARRVFIAVDSFIMIIWEM
jgi:hypothetical protein